MCGKIALMFKKTRLPLVMMETGCAGAARYTGYKKLWLTAVAVLVFLVMPHGAAQAGFEWTPPDRSQKIESPQTGTQGQDRPASGMQSGPDGRLPGWPKKSRPLNLAEGDEIPHTPDNRTRPATQGDPESARRGMRVINNIQADDIAPMTSPDGESPASERQRQDPRTGAGNDQSPLELIRRSRDQRSRQQERARAQADMARREGRNEPANVRRLMREPGYQPRQQSGTSRPAPRASGMSGRGRDGRGRDGYRVVRGFGDDLPLPIAMRQIIPPDYAYQFGGGVNPGIRVSWEGGKPWPQILRDTLSPRGLQAEVSGDTVMIGQARQSIASNRSPSQQSGAPRPLLPIKNGDTRAASDRGTMPSARVQDKRIQPFPKQGRVTQNRRSWMYNLTSTHKPFGVVDMNSRRIWSASTNDRSLREVLERWARRAGVVLYWKSAYDYPILNGFNLKTSFPDAVETLLSRYTNVKPEPNARLYPNAPQGPSVLVIE